MLVAAGITNSTSGAAVLSAAQLTLPCHVLLLLLCRHCLSAGATATINNLIADVEDERLAASSHKGKREIRDSCAELGVAKC